LLNIRSIRVKKFVNETVPYEIVPAILTMGLAGIVVFGISKILEKKKS